MDSAPGPREVGGVWGLIRRTSRYNNNENFSLCLNTCRSGCVLALLSVLWLFISACVCVCVFLQQCSRGFILVFWQDPTLVLFRVCVSGAVGSASECHSLDSYTNKKTNEEDIWIFKKEFLIVFFFPLALILISYFL